MDSKPIPTKIVKKNNNKKKKKRVIKKKAQIWKGPELLNFLQFVIFNLPFIQKCKEPKEGGKKGSMKGKFYQKLHKFLQDQHLESQKIVTHILNDEDSLNENQNGSSEKNNCLHSKDQVSGKFNKLFIKDSELAEQRNNMTFQNIQQKLSYGIIYYQDIVNKRFSHSNNSNEIRFPDITNMKTIARELQQYFKFSVEIPIHDLVDKDKFFCHEDWDQKVKSNYPKCLQIIKKYEEFDNYLQSLGPNDLDFETVEELEISLMKFEEKKDRLSDIILNANIQFEINVQDGTINVEQIAENLVSRLLKQNDPEIERMIE